MYKKICVVTGSRSEYGLLYWLLKEIKADSVLKLQLIVTGAHLSPEYGMTINKILKDEFIIDEKIEMLLSSDTAVGITKSIGLGVIGFSDAFARLKPDLIVLLGDRFETLAAAQAAFIAKIPIAHIHGGELSLGAYDDGIRHSITKMSQIHFVATPAYKQRVIQLGEQPDRVFHVGPMVLDSINNLTLLSKQALEAVLDIKFNKLNFVITFHPETMSYRSPQEDFLALLQALDLFQDATFIFTKTNPDTDCQIVNDMIDEYCQSKSDAKGFVELGHKNYLSLLNTVDIAIGNSSSGVIEVPFFKIPTINIGERQKGRIHPGSVINCEPKKEAIYHAINKGLSQDFRESIKCMQLPYGEGNVAKNVVNILKKVDFSKLIMKQFYDINFVGESHG